MAQFITDAIEKHCNENFHVNVYEEDNNFVTIYSTKDHGWYFSSHLCQAMAYIEKVTGYKVRAFNYSYDYRHSEGQAIVIFDKETSTPSC